MSYVFLCSYLRHLFPRSTSTKKPKQSVPPIARTPPKIIIPRNFLKQQTYCRVGQAEDRCLQRRTVSTLVSQSPLGHLGVGRLVDGWSRIGYVWVKFTSLGFNPFQLEAAPTGRWDCSAGLAWMFNKETSQFRREMSPLKQGFTNTGQS